MKKTLTNLFLILPLCAAVAQKPENPQLGKSSVERIVAVMTLEEKARLVVGASMEEYSGEGSVAGRTMRHIPGSAGTTTPFPAYGIPPTVMADGPAGLRIDPYRKDDDKTHFCTAFPIGTMLASTWNVPLVEQVGTAMGNEVLEYGCDVILGPGMNINRHPLCGRNFEYYSEDPLLSGKCGAAMVRGIQSQGVGTSVKHFAANNQEGLRLQNDAHVSQRALREIYLRGFEIAVKEGKPWTVMSSYNRLNGHYTQENRELLTSILRDEWGYDGIVVSDWIGQRNTVAQVHAGNDLMMPGEPAQSDEIVEAVRSGKLAERELDVCVRRMLEYICRTPRFKGYKYTEKPDFAAHAAVSRAAAVEGAVLLKNTESALPLREGAKVALFGVNGYDYIVCGTGAGFVNAAYKVNLDKGLADAGLTCNPKLDDLYRKYVSFGEALMAGENARTGLGNKQYTPESPLTPAFIADCAATSDVAVLSLGRLSGEGADRPSADFGLNEAERQLLERVCMAFHAEGKPVVVVLNVSGVVETASWKMLPDAILVTWLGGSEAGHATADLLVGKSNPSGRLPMTFPMNYADHPSSKNFPLDYRPYRGDWAYDTPERKMRNLGYTEYEEDIWVGYRYFSTYGRDRVSYPFGYGLSYTTFAWSDAAVKRVGNAYVVSLTVTNTGARSGKEVVELFTASPVGKLVKPVRELRAFAKTRELQAGESQRVELRFAAADLAAFDEECSAFVTDAGRYRIELCRSADEVVVELPMTVKAAVRKVQPLLRPQQPIHRMTF